jgi:hypothetical protein
MNKRKYAACRWCAEMGSCRKTRYVWDKRTRTSGIDWTACKPHHTVRSIVRGAMRRDSRV